jgi:hypothetical protein
VTVAIRVRLELDWRAGGGAGTRIHNVEAYAGRAGLSRNYTAHTES